MGASLSEDELDKAHKFEEKINARRNMEKEAAISRMQNGSDVKSELLYIDFAKHLEHIGDHALNITQTLRLIKYKN